MSTFERRARHRVLEVDGVHEEVVRVFAGSFFQCSNLKKNQIEDNQIEGERMFENEK